MTIEIERGLVKTSAGYIHYRAAGRGRPVILLHINQQSSALFLELMAVLGKELRAIAIDYPQHAPEGPARGDHRERPLLPYLGTGRRDRGEDDSLPAVTA